MEDERLVEPRRLRGVGASASEGEPVVPEPVDVGVVKPEDRIERGAEGIAHQPALTWVDQGAANGGVHRVVWRELQLAGGPGELGWSYPAAAEAGPKWR